MAKIHIGMYKIITVFSVLLVSLFACDSVEIAKKIAKNIEDAAGNTGNAGTVGVGGNTGNVGAKGVGGNTGNAGTGGVKTQPNDESVISIENISIEGTKKSVYGLDDRIIFLVRFTDAIVIPTGFAPTLRFTGTLFEGDNVATYLDSQDGGRTLRFEYVVKKHSVGGDTLTTVSNPLQRNGSSLSHADGKTVDVSYNEKRYERLDLVTPHITEISVVDDSDSPSKSYKTGVPMDIEVVFSEPVVKPTVGTLQLPLSLGETKSLIYATYVSGDGNDTFLFRYIPKPGDQGVIEFQRIVGVKEDDVLVKQVSDLAGNGIENKGHDITLPEGYSVVNDEEETKITDIRFVNDGPYTNTNRVIQIEVTFSKDVRVTGSPQLKLTVGNERRNALYSSSSGNKMIFKYYLKEDDNDSDGVVVPNDALKLSRSSEGTIPTIKDLADRDVDRSYAKTEGGIRRTVDMPPIGKTVSILSTPNNADGYGVGEVIKIGVIFSEDVTLNGIPYLKLDIGGQIKSTTSAYHLGRSKMAAPNLQRTVYFEYTVQAGDVDADGISLLNEGDFRHVDTSRHYLYYIYYPEGSSIKDTDDTKDKAIDEINVGKRIHFPAHKVNAPVPETTE